MKRIACSLLLVILGAPLASARDIGHDEALALRRAGTIIPLEQITRLALDRHSGARLLEVELEEEDAVLVYEVELLTTAGVVRELELDARSGRILKDEVD